MAEFSQKKFNEFILNNDIVGLFPKEIRLVSGRVSTWYINWRNVSADVYLIDILSDFVLAYVKSQGIELDCFYGTPEGATKLAVICQYKWAKAKKDFGPGKYILPMGRKHLKDHGDPKDRYFVGAPEGKVIAIEDVTSTGGSLLKTVETLTSAGVEVAATLALTDRNEVTDNGQHIREILKSRGIKHYAMSNALELLPIVVKRLHTRGIESIEAEFKKFGEKAIKL